MTKTEKADIIEIQVLAGCQDCPFRNSDGLCNVDDSISILSQGYPSKCPILDKPVFIKRKARS